MNAECCNRKKFGGPGWANARVELPVDDTLFQNVIFDDQPAGSESGESVSFGEAGENDRGSVQIGGRRYRFPPTMHETMIHLVREQQNIAALELLCQLLKK